MTQPDLAGSAETVSSLRQEFKHERGVMLVSMRAEGLPPGAWSALREVVDAASAWAERWLSAPADPDDSSAQVAGEQP